MAVVPRRKTQKSQSSSIETLSDLVNFAKENGVDAVPIDIERLAGLLNIKIFYEEMDEDTSGYLEERGGMWCIGVNKFHSGKRQRFTIAHELAHFVLHRESQKVFKDKTLFRHSQSSNKMEWEANSFAAALLMSESEFRGLVEHGKKDVASLARHFNVSEMSVRVRAKELGYRGHGL